MMDSLLDIFRHNFLVKLFALVGAAVLWFFVMSDQNPMMDSSVTVPVTFMGTPERVRVTSNVPNVKMKLRGARSAFASVRREEIKAVLDLSDKEPGTHHLLVQTFLPQGLEVVSLKPEYVDVLLDPLVQQRQPLHMIPTGTVGTGFTVSRITPETDHVFLDGPETLVDTVNEVIGYVPLSGDRTVDFDLRVPLSAVDADGRAVSDVTLTPEEVSVHVQLARGLSKKVVDIRPVVEGVPAEGYAVTERRTEPTRLEIAGDAATLERVSALETEPISVAGLSGSVRRPANLVLPEGVTVTNRTVTVVISVVRK